MTIDIRSLLEEAFYSDEAARATYAIAQARSAVSAAGQLAAFSMEVIVPDVVDEKWLHERVLRPLIYFCQSTGAAPPGCSGVFVSFFHGDRLSCVLAAEVISWAAAQLYTDEETLVERYGTHETEHAAPRAPG